MFNHSGIPSLPMTNARKAKPLGLTSPRILICRVTVPNDSQYRSLREREAGVKPISEQASCLHYRCCSLSVSRSLRPAGPIESIGTFGTNNREHDRCAKQLCPPRWSFYGQLPSLPTRRLVLSNSVDYPVYTVLRSDCSRILRKIQVVRINVSLFFIFIWKMQNFTFI